MSEPVLTRRDLLAGWLALRHCLSPRRRTGAARRRFGHAIAGPLHYASLADVARRIAAREILPSDLTQQMLDRIAAVDGRLQSYVTVMAEQALASARRADTEIRAGRYRGPLHGVPIGGEGPLLYARRSHHGGHEGLCRLRARLRRDRRRAAGSFGCDHPRQARPVRGCVRTVFPRPAGAREPVGRNAMERRLIERLRRGDGGGPVFRLGRHGHRGIDPVPVGRERMRGSQAHVRPREPLRRVRARPFHGPCRADGPHRGRRRHPVRSDGGRRSA